MSAMFRPSPEKTTRTFLLGDVIDLEPALRDDVLLAMPISPTCPDGCDRNLVGAAKRLEYIRSSRARLCGRYPGRPE